MTAKRVRIPKGEPAARQTRKASVPRTAEQIARAATAHLDPVGLDGIKVKLPLTLVLDREVAERLSARAIREGKNLDALIAEILEAAVR